MLLKYFFATVGPGPKFIPKGIFKLVRFPRTQIPIVLHVPIITAEAERADFYVDGKVVKFKDLPEDERLALYENPLSHTSIIIVEVILLIEFVREELYDFRTKFITFEELGRQLGSVVRNSLEGLMSKVTIITALEDKEILQSIFRERLLAVIHKPGSRQWGIGFNEIILGPTELDPRIKNAKTDVAIAFAEKKRMIVLAEGHGQALGAVAKYVKSDAGRLAAGFEVSEKIAEAAKLIVAPGFSGLVAAGSEALDSIKNLK
jgi:hypothetical protein